MEVTLSAPFRAATEFIAADLVNALVNALTPDPERAVRGQIAELVAHYGNPNTVMEDAAAAAAREGRAAFWKRTGYSNAIVGLVCGNANLGCLEQALDAFCEDRPSARRADVIKQLIPLNVRAEIELRAVTALFGDA
jgi:hypothetical protein